MRFCLLAVALFSLGSVSVCADYQLGLEAYEAGDYERAFSEWIKVVASAPEEVNPAILAETQYAIGMLYWTGQGVPQDTVAAANWLRRAAEMNHAGAQAKLGYLYTTGQGVPQNDFEALKWLQMAASQGDADAQYNLGVLYRDGKGVRQDPERALHWFREAAAQGDAVSAGIVAAAEKSGGPGDETGGGNAAAMAMRRDSTAKSSSAKFPPDVHPGPAAAPVLNEEWIRQRNPGHYTIQVIALLQPARLYDFVERHQDWSPLAIYRQQWQGKPLWVLVQGDYADVAEARAAVQVFPAGLQERENMWIRRFEMVQELLPQRLGDANEAMGMKR